MDTTPKSEFVECHYNGSVFFIPNRLMARLLLEVEIEQRHYVRYKTGAYLFDMSVRQFSDMAHDADSVYKYYGCALVNPKEVDAYVKMLK